MGIYLERTVGKLFCRNSCNFSQHMWIHSLQVRSLCISMFSDLPGFGFCTALSIEMKGSCVGRLVSRLAILGVSVGPLRGGASGKSSSEPDHQNDLGGNCIVHPWLSVEGATSSTPAPVIAICYDMNDCECSGTHRYCALNLQNWGLLHKQPPYISCYHNKKLES